MQLSRLQRRIGDKLDELLRASRTLAENAGHLSGAAVEAIDRLADKARRSAGFLEMAASDIAFQTDAIRADLASFAADLAA